MISKLEKDRKEAVETHNLYRKNHLCEDMVLDQKLCQEAQKYAEHLAKINRAIHDPSTNCGENIIIMRGFSFKL